MTIGSCSVVYPVGASIGATVGDAGIGAAGMGCSVTYPGILLVIGLAFCEEDAAVKMQLRVVSLGFALGVLARVSL